MNFKNMYQIMSQIKKQLQMYLCNCLNLRGPCWARTSDPLIMSQML